MNNGFMTACTPQPPQPQADNNAALQDAYEQGQRAAQREAYEQAQQDASLRQQQAQQQQQREIAAQNAAYYQQQAELARQQAEVEAYWASPEGMQRRIAIDSQRQADRERARHTYDQIGGSVTASSCEKKRLVLTCTDTGCGCAHKGAPTDSRTFKTASDAAARAAIGQQGE